MRTEDHHLRIELLRAARAWLVAKFEEYTNTPEEQRKWYDAPRLCFAINALDISKELHDALQFEIRLACGVHPNKWSDVHSTRPALHRRLALLDSVIKAHEEAAADLLWQQKQKPKPLKKGTARKKRRTE